MMPIESLWVLLGLLFAAGALGFYAARRPRPSTLGAEHVRKTYLAGVNFLVNEQPDRALEEFLRASELDGETVETHFALGSLYRRRGETDRAIRVHQNIINRTTLEPAQREQAQYALGLDYLRAGLLDRAEAIFEELAAAGAHRMAAMRKLIRIYEMQREWRSAIRVHEELARVGRPPQESAIAHYWCELAEASRLEGRLEEALQCLQKARATDPGFTRSALIRADIAIEQQDPGLARRLLASVIARDAGLVVEALPRLVRLARLPAGGGDAMLAEVLRVRQDQPAEIAFAAVLADALEFPSIEAIVRDRLARDEALSAIMRAVGREPAALDSGAIRSIAAALRRLAAGSPRYRCAVCGFSSASHFWQCPGCKTWDSQRPVVRFDLSAALSGPGPASA
jgi:lipopolysaccharide biosynthesis regulator YciM